MRSFIGIPLLYSSINYSSTTPKMTWVLWINSLATSAYLFNEVATWLFVNMQSKKHIHCVTGQEVCVQVFFSSRSSDIHVQWSHYSARTICPWRNIRLVGLQLQVEFVTICTYESKLHTGVPGCHRLQYPISHCARLCQTGTRLNCVRNWSLGYGKVLVCWCSWGLGPHSCLTWGMVYWLK